MFTSDSSVRFFLLPIIEQGKYALFFTLYEIVKAIWVSVNYLVLNLD